MRQPSASSPRSSSLAVIVQVGFAGYGAFNAIDKADDAGSITKKTIENGFDPHGIVGLVAAASLMVVLVLGRSRPAATSARIATVLLVLGIVQMLLAAIAGRPAAVGRLLPRHQRARHREASPARWPAQELAAERSP